MTPDLTALARLAPLEGFNAFETAVLAAGFHRRVSSVFQHFSRAPCLGADSVNGGSNRSPIYRRPSHYFSFGSQFIRIFSGATRTRDLRGHLRSGLEVVGLEWLSQRRNAGDTHSRC